MVVEVISSQNVGLMQEDISIAFLHFQVVHDESLGIGGLCSADFYPPISITLDSPFIGVGK